MEIRQGDIFWVDAEKPIGSAPGFTRPFVVIQNNLFNRGKISTVFGLRLDNKSFKSRRARKCAALQNGGEFAEAERRCRFANADAR